MQKFLSIRSSLIIGLLIAATSLSCAQAPPDRDSALAGPVMSRTTSEAVKNSAELSEFEGRYQVGGTTCTVTPAKMAYAIQWAKGQSPMHFFFDGTLADGKTVFVSKDSGKGRDQFVFDDNLYNSGKFIRADGKVFTVKRLNDSNQQ